MGMATEGCRMPRSSLLMCCSTILSSKRLTFRQPIEIILSGPSHNCIVPHSVAHSSCLVTERQRDTPGSCNHAMARGCQSVSHRNAQTPDSPGGLVRQHAALHSITSQRLVFRLVELRRVMFERVEVRDHVDEYPASRHGMQTRR